MSWTTYQSDSLTFCKRCFAHRYRRGNAQAALSAFAIAQLKKALKQTPLMSALSDAQDRVSCHLPAACVLSSPVPAITQCKSDMNA